MKRIMTVQDVLLIRKRDDQGQYAAPVGYFARYYKVSAEHIRRIRRGEAYSWVEAGLEPIQVEDEEILAHMAQLNQPRAPRPAPPPIQVDLEELERIRQLSDEFKNVEVAPPPPPEKSEAEKEMEAQAERGRQLAAQFLDKKK